MEANTAAETVGKQDDRNRVRSPEELDAYIRVVRPGTIFLIGAFTLVVVALVVWGLTGSLPITINAKGVYYSEYARAATQAVEEGRLEEFKETTESLSEEDRASFGESYVYCFLNAYQYNRQDLVDKKAAVAYPGMKPVQGNVIGVGTIPYTKDMIAKEFGTSFIADTCATSDYSWVVEIQTDELFDIDMRSLMDVTVEIGQVKPMSMLFQ